MAVPFKVLRLNQAKNSGIIELFIPNGLEKP
ncbi:unannotated protein [freshwater metagenome]|uniref:Unannotated protein n=1 Tax=freshwater metagenome TaxID=449393 RepID=A0A6J6ISJ0_9ZZZZ